MLEVLQLVPSNSWSAMVPSARRPNAVSLPARRRDDRARARQHRREHLAAAVAAACTRARARARRWSCRPRPRCVHAYSATVYGGVHVTTPARDRAEDRRSPGGTARSGSSCSRPCACRSRRRTWHSRAPGAEPVAEVAGRSSLHAVDVVAGAVAEAGVVGAPPSAGERAGRARVDPVVDRAAELGVAVGAEAARAVGDVAVRRSRLRARRAPGDRDRGADHRRADDEPAPARLALEHARRPCSRASS